MIVRKDNSDVPLYGGEYIGKEIIIAIDSSKRNSGFTVGDMGHNILNVWEFNGKDDGTRLEDTLTLCQEERTALRKIFAGSKPKIVGIENIITKNNSQSNSKSTVKRKKSEEDRNGMTEHESRFKITAVFMSFISFFQDEFGITPELVNNWTWKASVLPEEFRSRSVGKGSLAYFKSIKSKYGLYSDDATDSICIFEFLCKKHNIIRAIKITEPQIARVGIKEYLVQVNRILKHPTVLFVYNTEMSLKQNAIVMGNSIQEGQVGVTVVKTSDLTFDEIYDYCAGDFNTTEEFLKLAVRRV